MGIHLLPGLWLLLPGDGGQGGQVLKGHSDGGFCGQQHAESALLCCEAWKVLSEHCPYGTSSGLR